ICITGAFSKLAKWANNFTKVAFDNEPLRSPQNMIAQSQSGTGKTAAFVIAMLSRVEPSEKYPQVLCLSPTLELALQIGQVVKKIGQFCTDIDIRYAVRGEEVSKYDLVLSSSSIKTTTVKQEYGFKFMPIRKQVGSNSTDGMLENNLGPQNMIAQSQSGTGKTAAFVIAMLSRVEPSEKYPQVLCLSPTLELALQIGQVVKKIGQFCTDIDIRYAVRGEEAYLD
ncbi:hypothetical protein QYM36_003739, partial [Artemia franciscana]